MILRPDMPRRIAAPDLAAAQLPERASILDPILSAKTLALLYGPRGLGKTFVALGIAWAAASGGSFLGWRASRPHRVVYVDGEMAAGHQPHDAHHNADEAGQEGEPDADGPQVGVEHQQTGPDVVFFTRLGYWAA